jgi:hypothetical protein
MRLRKVGRLRPPSARASIWSAIASYIWPQVRGACPPVPVLIHLKGREQIRKELALPSLTRKVSVDAAGRRAVPAFGVLRDLQRILHGRKPPARGALDLLDPCERLIDGLFRAEHF